MLSGLTVSIPGESSNLLGYFDHATALAQPTLGDCLYAGQRQRSRILQRTQQGVDFNNIPFAPYSTKGPFYYYPNSGGAEKGRATSARNLANKLGIAKSGVSHVKNSKFAIKYGTKAHSGFTAERTRLGIKFSSYAAFKAFLDRIGVDLYGPKAPHMLQALIVKVGGIVIGDDEGWRDIVTDTAETSGLDKMTPANEIILGIYGAEAERAEGHNKGAGHLPQRKFLSANEQDKTSIIQDIVWRSSYRVRMALKGQL